MNTSFRRAMPLRVTLDQPGVVEIHYDKAEILHSRKNLKALNFSKTEE